MNPVIHSENRQSIVYDADRIPEPELRLLDPEYWQETGAVQGHARGRGTALLLQTPFGPAVLRTYLRGGWPARFSKDRYVYTGLAKSRPFLEFSVLAKLAARGLPVPNPLAARCDRGLFSYRGALLMERIPDVKPLTELLGRAETGSPVWGATGACIRRFHDAGVHHADLNANNLLIAEQGTKVYLVDFDRCTVTPEKMIDGRSNLARLKRSLLKLWPAETASTLEASWQALLDGYHA